MIMFKKNLTHSQMTYEKKSEIDPAPLHDFYRTWFGIVDKADRYWYDVAEHHRNERWKYKFLISKCLVFGSTSGVEILERFSSFSCIRFSRI